jgi:phage-related protein
LNPTLSTIKAKFISTTTGVDFDDSIDDLKQEVGIIKSQVDREFTIWFYDYTPTLSNLPASDWTTDDLKQMHLQDLFYDRESGNAYRFEQNDSGNYYWEIITDAETVRALEKANVAQDTADSKRRVFVE